MSARTYARMQDGVVAEMLTTQNDISEMFVPSLTWIDVSSTPEVEAGWSFDGARFAAPVVTAPSGTNPTWSSSRARSLL